MEYNTAICRGIPSSLIEGGQRLENDHSPIDEALMRRQHDEYTDALKKCGLKVIELPADESLPDCVFTEDAAVVVAKKVVLTNQGHPNRQGEAKEMRKALEQAGVEVFDMTEEPDSHVDGGDVLFTGSEIFIGDSKRSNEAGADFLRKSFGLPVHQIKVDEGLHLKSNCSMLGFNKIIISNDKDGKSMAKGIIEAAQNPYTFVFVPDIKASNVVSFNDTVFIPAGYPESRKIIEENIGQSIKLVELGNTELAKVDGCLTCCSVLINA